MLDINKVDKIVISNNNKMELIIQWYKDNEFLLKDREWKTPINRGFVELREEHLGFSFDNHGVKTIMTIYAKQVDVINGEYKPIITFDYNVMTGIKNNQIYHTPKNLIINMRQILIMDNTIEKECLKYRAIMSYMVYNREYKVSENKTVHTKTTAVKYSNKHYNSLQTRVYIFNDKTTVGHHNSPSYEFEVRGYYRHYKNGKVIWVDGFTKCKGKGKPQNKNYQF